MIDRKEVAKLANVSCMTVTRVVSGKGYVAEKTRRRVQKVIDETGYIPNKIAANLVSRKSNRIAIIVPELANPYYLQVVEAMMAQAKKYGYVLSIFKAYEEELPEVLEEVISNRVAGVVNYTLRFPPRYIKGLEEIGARLIRAGEGKESWKLSLDYSGAMREAMDFLISRGARKMLFVAGLTEQFASYDSRVPFFCEYMREKGLRLEAGDILYGDYPLRDAYAVGQSAAEELLRQGRRFDAVFCINDMMALGFMRAMKKGGRRIPEDAAVIGFDNIRMSDAFEPELATIAADTEEEGRLCVDFIAGRAEQKGAELAAVFYPRQSAFFVKR